jgi:hypothetical protein
MEEWMAFRLTKDEQTQKTKIQASLQASWDALEDAKAGAEDKIRTALEELNVFLEAYQKVVSEAEAFREEVAGRLREEWDEKSDGWQEGDKGQEANSFIEEWENASMEPEMSYAAPEIDFGEGETLLGTLEDLPTEN